MGIKLITPKSKINAMIQQQFQDVERQIINILLYAGESAVIQARTSGNYTDRTGNLRSSIGYVIVKRGEIVEKSAFNVVKGGQEGSREGLNLAIDLAKEFPTDYVLIVVAGMNYATYVERKGFDVLSSAQTKAESIAKQLISRL